MSVCLTFSFFNWITQYVCHFVYLFLFSILVNHSIFSLHYGTWPFQRQRKSLFIYIQPIYHFNTSLNIMAGSSSGRQFNFPSDTWSALNEHISSEEYVRAGTQNGGKCSKAIASLLLQQRQMQQELSLILGQTYKMNGLFWWNMKYKRRKTETVLKIYIFLKPIKTYWKIMS